MSDIYEWCQHIWHLSIMPTCLTFINEANMSGFHAQCQHVLPSMILSEIHPWCQHVLHSSIMSTQQVLHSSLMTNVWHSPMMPTCLAFMNDANMSGGDNRVYQWHALVSAMVWNLCSAAKQFKNYSCTQPHPVKLRLPEPETLPCNFRGAGTSSVTNCNQTWL